MSQKPKQDDPAQSARFVEIAHEIAADDNETPLEETLKRLAKTPPTPITGRGTKK